MGSEENRFLRLQEPPTPRRKRWGGCFGGLSFFRKKKGGKRIVPSSRATEANGLNQPNGPQGIGLPNQATGIALALLAPPSSPASFSNSALQSTAQSPNCFLSANSPVGPSNTMFVMGPYAHETQLVSPPVFSTFTTEPSTAPLTPPPEAHLTTPSSPDVPYAHFLSSSAKIKTHTKMGFNSGNDLQATYSLYPGSPASALRSPASRTPRTPAEMEFTYQNSDPGRYIGLQGSGPTKAREDTNFFHPDTFAQFYLDQSSLSHAGGRLSISRESDAYANGGNVHQMRSKSCKPDPEELDAYRASFGFSADEVITTAHYVEISDVMDNSFTTAPVNYSKHVGNELVLHKRVESEEREEELAHLERREARQIHVEGLHSGVQGLYGNLEDQVRQKRSGRNLQSNYHALSDDDDLFSRKGRSRIGRKYNFGASNSDAEIEYRRGRSLRERRSRNAAIYGLE